VDKNDQGKMMTLKIRTWVLLACGLILVPMAAVLLLALREIDADEKALIDSEVRARTSELVHAIDKRIAVSIQALQTLGNSEVARRGDWSAVYQLAKQVVATNPYYASVTLVDPQDQLIFVTSVPFGQRTFKPAYPDLVREVFNTAQPNVSGPFTVPISQHHLIAVSIPLIREGRVTHVLRMILRTESISQLLVDQDLPDGWITAVADQNGTLVARSVSPETFVGQPASATFREAIKRKDAKIYKGVTLEGTPNTSLVLPAQNSQWFVAVAVPDFLIEQRYWWNVFVVSMAFLAIVSLGVLVALGLARFFADQTFALEKAVGSGHPDSPLPWGLRILELQRVYQSYRDVSSREQRAQNNLEFVTTEKDEVQDLYEQAPCGYHSLDIQGRFVRINQTMLGWLGRTREQVLGQPFASLLTDASQAFFQQMFPTFVAQGHIENLEFELVRADGSTFPVIINATMLMDKEGRPVMSRSTVFDLTERKKLERQLEQLSNTDVLTGLCNRRHFYELALNELERSRRQASPLVVAMLDVDHFKQVNDRHGHAMGDRVLVALGETVMAELRSIDIFARFGGEEFVILMPHTPLEAAVTVLERLREALASSRVLTDGGESIGFTVSIGVGLLRPDDANIDVLMARADSALYQAKRSGRDRVCVA
jgi:diguanylate cyclase (GGDEF)-like protein/PAS domain S-box-containing protein